MLKDSYAKAAEAISFVQELVGMIEVIQSDFARLKSETSIAGTESQKQYDEFMTVSR